MDPAACLVVDGKLASYVEEERLIRFKHANNIFPIRSMEFCLKKNKLNLDDIDFFAFGWDAPRYTNGSMARFYDEVNREYPPDPATVAWQRRNLSYFREDSLKELLQKNLTKYFGKKDTPKLKFFPHHASHAANAYYPSPFEEALILTIDGSGDSQCTSIWQARGNEIKIVHEIPIPHSLGWFYAAMTEFLGFDAYDGEYKVMGLAAYGRENLVYRSALEKIVFPAANGYDYRVDPRYIFHGPHTYSERFTDFLPELIGMNPRLGNIPISAAHEDLAFEAQRILEQTVFRLLKHFRKEIGLERLCISGGVGLNVKMNSIIHRSGLFDDIFIFPIPSDSGTGIGAAYGLYAEMTGRRPAALDHVFLGPGYTDDEIEQQIKSCGLAYRRCKNLAEDTADLLVGGKVVAWFQGAMEGGPRALGGRSILADPRREESRDRVNSAIKFREYWRPFCPSVLKENADNYIQHSVNAPFMILAFEATEQAKQKVPAVVHIDNSMRVQTVDKDTNPAYYRLLKSFEKKTGVPVLLNTSFNIKGEAIVCSPRDALRTFMSTGIDAMAIGSFIIEKPKEPERIKPEEVIR